MEQLDQHKKSKNHKKSEKLYAAEHKDASSSSMFQNVSVENKQ